jgi:hypothetical protein
MTVKDSANTKNNIKSTTLSCTEKNGNKWDSCIYQRAAVIFLIEGKISTDVGRR